MAIPSLPLSRTPTDTGSSFWGPRANAVADEALSNMIVLEAKETFVKDLEVFLTTFVARCRGEEGCLKYDCFQSFEKPSRFMLVMEWSEERSLQRHFESEHVREFFDRVGK